MLRPFLVSLALLAALARTGEVLLRSKLNTDQQYRSPNLPSNELYSIGVTRTESSLESESSKCRAVNKYTEVARQTELVPFTPLSSGCPGPTGSTGRRRSTRS